MYQYMPNFTPRRVVIFGTGGTGSRLVPLVVQFVKSLNWVINPEFVLVDFDEVETKNLKRQNFIEPDVGRNKAIVLAERYGTAFGANVTAMTSRMLASSDTGSEMARMVATSSGHIDNVLFILCVDSVSARKEILSNLNNLLHRQGTTGRYLILDAGNEDSFGQIKIVGAGMNHVIARELHANRKHLSQQVVEPLDIGMMPFDDEYFDSMVEGTAAGSCADLDQTMAINTLMAVNLFTVVQNIYFSRPITWHRLDVCIDGTALPQLIKRDYLLPFAEKAHNGIAYLPSMGVDNYGCMGHARESLLTGEENSSRIKIIREHAKSNLASA